MAATSSTDGAGTTGGFCAGLQEWWSGVTSGFKGNLTNTGIAGPSTNGAGLTTDLPIKSIRENCPIPIIVKVTTRVGDIPVPGVRVFCGGETEAASLGITGRDGLTPLGHGNACDNQATITVFYKNDDARLKLERVRFQITGIQKGGGGVTAATGGQVEHVIEKIIDAYGEGGDKNFTNRYSGADLIDTQNGKLVVNVKLATLSLDVPYDNQREKDELDIGSNLYGDRLCGASSHTMIANYWSKTDFSRNQDIREVSAANGGTYRYAGYDIWQHYDRVAAGALAKIANAHYGDANLAGVSFTTGPDIPSSQVDKAFLPKLALGEPALASTYATAGHIMVVRGCVVTDQKSAHYLIMNDPYGSLITASSKYDDGKNVGYSHEENEYNKSGMFDDKGRHVYYSRAMEARSGAFRLKGGALSLKRSPSFSTDELAQRVTKGE